MVKNIDDMQRFGRDGMEATLKSLGAISKGVQAIGLEMADYSKKAVEESTAATERLLGAKSLDRAFEVQSEYVRSAYEAFVARAARLSELYADMAQESYKPFESLAKATTVR